MKDYLSVNITKLGATTILLSTPIPLKVPHENSFTTINGKYWATKKKFSPNFRAFCMCREYFRNKFIYVHVIFRVCNRIEIQRFWKKKNAQLVIAQNGKMNLQLRVKCMNEWGKLKSPIVGGGHVRSAKIATNKKKTSWRSCIEGFVLKNLNDIHGRMETRVKKGFKWMKNLTLVEAIKVRVVEQKKID